MTSSLPYGLPYFRLKGSKTKSLIMAEGNYSQKSLWQEVLQLIKTPIVLSFIVTPVRYVLELVGIHENYIFLLGLLWLTIGISIYWGIKFHYKHRFLLIIFISLLIYSIISRIPVAIAWWVDTKWELGTHYGLFFDTFEQVLLNQVVYGSIVQIVPGYIIGLLTFAIMKRRVNLEIKTRSVQNG